MTMGKGRMVRDREGWEGYEEVQFMREGRLREDR